jgi:hypothetical protein
MASKIKKSDLLKAYERVDLYRAKYPHQDLTPHGWCFHGNKPLGWTGTAHDRRLYLVDGETSISGLNIDTSTYKYLSTSLLAKNEGIVVGETIEETLLNGDYTEREIDWVSSGCTQCYSELDSRANYEMIIPEKIRVVFQVTNSIDLTYSFEEELGDGNNLIRIDLGDIGTIERIGIKIEYLSDGTWSTYTNKKTNIEYIKVDSKDIFREVYDEERTITQDDINYLRDLVDEINKSPIDWERTGSLDDRVKKFVSTIKKDTLPDIIDKVGSIDPYNGCDQCDSFTCECYSEAYGFMPCQTCDGCDIFTTCSVCDMTCDTEAIACTCDQECYQEAVECGCYSECYRRSCRCYNEFY